MTNGEQLFAPEVRGTFYRAVDPRFRRSAIAGSRAAGRYSRADQPTLYLSSSVEGVEAALIAHPGTRSADPVVLEVDVVASRIIDLRDGSAREAAGIDLGDATAPWQQVVADGGVPTSWLVRDRLTELGATGLIDPSRKHPGLWHLVLLRWNEDDAPKVHVRGAAAD